KGARRLRRIEHPGDRPGGATVAALTVALREERLALRDLGGVEVRRAARRTYRLQECRELLPVVENTRDGEVRRVGRIGDHPGRAVQSGLPRDIESARVVE